MPGRKRPSDPIGRWLRGTAALVAILVTGCATVPEPPPAPEEKDPLQRAEEEIVGTVIFVDPAEGVALVEVRSPTTRAAPVLLTRNEALVETGRLEPTRFQRGRTLGTRIVSGLPNVGDEVLAP